jgi:hypothetical protein
MQFSSNSEFGAKSAGRWLLAVAGMLLAASAPALAEHPVTTLTTLLDRAYIEDMLVDYYGQLGSNRSDFGSFYVPDGILDVNGIVAQGQKPIEDLYKKIGGQQPRPVGTFRMLLTNPKIVVNGDSATADVIWTGVISETKEAAPKFVEQGREHDELVKRDGKWLFKHRYITSDGGLTPMFEKTYKKR